MVAAIAGSTGLVGSHLVEICSHDPHFTKVKAMARRKGPSIPKVEWNDAPFENHNDLVALLSGVDLVFCCLGTTMKKAGSKEAFRKVDYHFVLNLCIAAREARCGQLHIVSAIGSNAASGIFYNRVKGEMEDAVAALGLPSMYIYRPGMLMGKRTEFRMGERIGIVVFRALSPLLVGSARKYRGINAEDVAAAMAACARRPQPGLHILHYPEMMAAIQS